MCVAASSMCTANAVASPPSPCGPTPSRLTAAESSASSCRAVGIGAVRAERARRRALRERDAQVGRAADADADDRRRAGLAAGREHAVDDERLDRVDAFGGDRHLEERVVLRAAALGDHLDDERRRASSTKSTWITGTSMPHDVCSLRARERMHDRRAQRMLARRALAARGGSPPSVAGPSTSTLRPIDDVVDRHAGVLAEQVVGALGDRDVGDHRAEHALRRARAVSLAAQRVEAGLDVRRQDLERADVELLAASSTSSRSTFMLMRPPSVSAQRTAREREAGDEPAAASPARSSSCAAPTTAEFDQQQPHAARQVQRRAASRAPIRRA